MAADREIIPRTIVVGSSTFVSRVLGLAREMLTAQMFGATRALDLFLVAFTIPNLSRRIFGEGAMRDAFLPVFGRELKKSDGDPERLFNAVMTALAALLGGVTLLGWLGCWAAYRFAPISDDGRLFCVLLALMLPYMPLICLSALESAALNQKGRFLLPALAPSLLNVCWILGLLLFGKERGINALAGSVLVAGALQYAVQVPALWRHRIRLRPVWDLAGRGLRRVLALLLPVAVGSGVFQLNVMADRLIAYFCVPGEGAVSVLHYGNRLMQLPLGVLGLAVATAAFPSFVGQAADGDRRRLVQTAGLALRSALFLVLPCMAALIALRLPIVQVLFARGRFIAEADIDATARTARALLFYAAGLWAFCLLSVLTRVFYALEDTRTPVRIGMVMVGVNLALNLVLVWPMREAGLALASSITAAGNVGILFYLLRRRLGSVGTAALCASAWKSAVAAGSAGLAGAGAFGWVVGLPQVAGRFATLLGPRIIALAAAVGAAGAVFLLASWLLKSSELRDFARACWKRPGRRA